MSILTDATDILGVRDLFTLYKGINQVKIDNRLADSTNTINELNASATLQRLQNEAIQNQEMLKEQSFLGEGWQKYAGYGLLALAAVAAGYLLIKK